jgi:hypothetical protein
MIKAVRQHTTYGLKEAKELVESAPCIIARNIERREAEVLITALHRAGAQADLIRQTEHTSGGRLARRRRRFFFHTKLDTGRRAAYDAP